MILFFYGQASTLVIGDGELEWDSVGIIEAPSIAAFPGITSSEEYKKIHVHREAGLEHQLLVQCSRKPLKLLELLPKGTDNELSVVCLSCPGRPPGSRTGPFDKTRQRSEVAPEI